MAAPVAQAIPKRGFAAARGALALCRDPYRIFIALVLIMTVSRIHQHFKFLTPLRPALVITAMAAVYAYMNPKYLASGSMVRTWPAKAILGMFLAACASTPLGISMGGSGSFILFEYSKTIIFAFLLIAALRNVRDLYTMVWAFVVSAGALSYLSLFVFRMLRTSNDGLLRIQNGYSYDSNDIAMVAVTCLGLAVMMVQVSKGQAKILAVMIVLGLGGTIAKTGSRGGFLGLMAFGCAMLVLLKTVPVAKRVLFLGVTMIALTIAAPPGYWDQMKTIFTPTEDYNWTSPTGRKAVFDRGIGYMMRNPVTGIGIDNFPRAEGTLSSRAVAQAQDRSLAGIKWSAAHNSFLEVAAEMGVVGLSLFLSLIFAGIIGVRRVRRRMPARWSRGTQEERFLYLLTLYLPVSFITFSASGFFVSFAYRDLIYVLGAFTVGLIVSVEAKLKQERAMQMAPGSPAPVPGPVISRGATPGGPSLRFPLPPAGPSV
jgi:O-antigen ligase